MRFIIDAWADGYDNQKDEEEAIRVMLEDAMNHGGSHVTIVEVIHDNPDPYIS